MSRADVQQNQVSSGIETLGDWQGSFPNDLQRIEVLVRLPDMSVTPTASSRPRADAVSAGGTCGPPEREERASPVPAGGSGWIPDWNCPQWADKLRPWGQTAQAAAAVAVLLLIVIALLLIRGPGGEEPRPAALPPPQEEGNPQLALPMSPQERAVGFQDLPIIPLLPQTLNPREIYSGVSSQAGHPADGQGTSAANAQRAAASAGPAEEPADRQTPEAAAAETSSKGERAAEEASNQQEPSASADVAEPRRPSSAELATGASASQEPSLAESRSGEASSAGEEAEVPRAASSSQNRHEETSGERLAERADESPQREAGESAPAIAPPPAPSLETQFTQHSGAADGSSRGTASPVDHRSYPETNPSSYRYPSTYHRLFFPAGTDSAGTQGVPSRETRSIYEPPSNTARLQPQLEPPPLR